MPQAARRVRSRLGSPRVKALAPETIATDRLVLRRPKISDALAVFAYGSDPEVARYMDWPVLAHVDDAVRATEKALRGWESGDEFSWRITVKPDDTPIGAISCRITDDGADFGFVLARSRWGSGYATETARALLAWLTSLEEVRRIQATCDVDNPHPFTCSRSSECRNETSCRAGRSDPTFPADLAAMRCGTCGRAPPEPRSDTLERGLAGSRAVIHGVSDPRPWRSRGRRARNRSVTLA